MHYAIGRSSVIVGLLAFAVAAVVVVTAQCDPTVCANPGAFQALTPPPSVRGRKQHRKLGALSGRGGGGVRAHVMDAPFQAFGSFLAVPPIPTNPTTAINQTFYSMLEATFVSDDPNMGTQQLLMSAQMIYQPDQSAWSMQAWMILEPAGYVLPSPLVMIANTNQYINVTLANLPQSSTQDAMLVATMQPTAVGSAGLSLVSQYTPTELVNITLSAGLLVESTNGQDLSNTPCDSLPNANSNAFSNLAIQSVAGPVPVSFIVDVPPVPLYCGLQAVVITQPPGITIEWGNTPNPNSKPARRSRHHNRRSNVRQN